MNIKTLTFTFLISILSLVASAQEITLFPGFLGYKYYQDNTQISKADVKNLMSTDAHANKYWKKSVNHQAIGAVLLGAELGLALWSTQKITQGDERIWPLIGVLATGATSIGFSLSSIRMKRKAILTYNENKDMGSLKLGLNPNGLGLVYQW